MKAIYHNKNLRCRVKLVEDNKIELVIQRRIWFIWQIISEALFLYIQKGTPLFNCKPTKETTIRGKEIEIWYEECLDLNKRASEFMNEYIDAQSLLRRLQSKIEQL